LKGRYSTSIKDVSWGYKLHRSDQSFNSLQDGKTRARMVCGGYTPKLYDRHFLDMHNSNEFEHLLDEAAFISESHYTDVEKYFSSIQ
jgi:hypothetical protein